MLSFQYCLNSLSRPPDAGLIHAAVVLQALHNW